MMHGVGLLGHPSLSYDSSPRMDHLNSLHTKKNLLHLEQSSKSQNACQPLQRTHN